MVPLSENLGGRVHWDFENVKNKVLRDRKLLAQDWYDGMEAVDAPMYLMQSSSRNLSSVWPQR